LGGASVEALNSVLNAANEFHDQVRYQKEDSTSVGKHIESEDAHDHDRALIDGLALPSDNINLFGIRPKKVKTITEMNRAQ
jgi:hypothetical protein